MAESEKVLVEWMWADCSTGGLAKVNPFRWSKAKGITETIDDLNECARKDKYDANRPVTLYFTDKEDKQKEAVQKTACNVTSAVDELRAYTTAGQVQTATTAPAAATAAARPATPVADGEFATLILPDGREHKIKVMSGNMGEERYLDIRDLNAKTGCFTYDPGFTCTASCMSAITFIDGEKGVCLYRGYPVAELCETAKALEVAYLLIFGDLPEPDEMQGFKKKINENMMIHGKVKRVLDSLPLSAHPMASMVAVIGGLSTIFSKLDPNSEADRVLACERMVAKMPVLAAMAYKTSIGQPVVYPREEFDFAENWLHMMFSTPLREYKVDPIHAKAINAFMILHMDHEQNASTSTVRTAGSSGANPYACMAAGVASLWGPAHGGANEAVIKMLEEIGTADRVPQFVEDVKNKKEGVRLMGFGHRVYKNYDPRARVMKGLVTEVLTGLAIHDPLLEVAHALEACALEDDYFVKRKLYPNVDYYSGIMLRAIGIPTSMFTVMFAMSRTVGWMAQWNEMHIRQDQMRIARPRQIYAGKRQRSYAADRPRADSSPTRKVSDTLRKGALSQFSIDAPQPTVTR